ASEVAEFGVMAVGVAPGYVAADEAGLGGVVWVIGAIQAEVADAAKLRLDAVQPGGVVGCVGKLDVVCGGPLADGVAFVDSEVVEYEAEPHLGRVQRPDNAAEGEE